MKSFKYLMPLLMLSSSIAKGEAETSGPEEMVTVANHQKSAFVIILQEQASSAVKAAARELQRCVQEATGATLEIVGEGNAGERPFISIGETQEAEKAGMTAKGLGDDGYRIGFHEGNILIVGNDSPEGGWTSGGGVSRGSAHGVYAFLEETLDVRWLMPGDDGRDVPSRDSWEVAQIAREGKPAFHMRELSHLSDFASPAQVNIIREWMSRQRLGSSVAIRHVHNRREDHWQHNWAWITDDPSLYAKHPEWFALNATGKRWHPGNHYAKLETTNPELIRFFADRAINTLKSSPQPRVFSLTPNDSPTRWSESDESKALYDPPVGEGLETAEFKPQVPSKTSLVMQWYSDVAKIVKKEYPAGKLTGFIYSDYLYPPVKFTDSLPDNLALVLCGPNYGYELNTEAARKRLAGLVNAWQKLATGGLYYYDIPNLLLRQEDSDARFNFPGTTALITPAAPESLDFLFSLMREHEVKGAYLYGAASWSNAAMTNYIIARLFWEPDQDAHTLQKEWLERAYGTAAAVPIQKLYTRLDELYRSFGYIGYNLTSKMLAEIYAQHYTELEGYYLEAAALPMSDVQKRRLERLGANLSALQWRLQNMGLRKPNETSALTRTNEEIVAMLLDEGGDYPAFPGALPSPSAFQPDFSAVALRPSIEDAKRPELASTTWAVLHSPKGGPIEIMPEIVDHGAYVATYLLKNQQDEVVASGILTQGKAITLQAAAGDSLYLSMPPRSRRSDFPTRCELRIKGATLAEAAVENDQLLIKDTGAMLYVWGDKGGIKTVGNDVVVRK